jgi:hypothetical protein
MTDSAAHSPPPELKDLNFLKISPQLIAQNFPNTELETVIDVIILKTRVREI